MPETQTIKKYMDGRAFCADWPGYATSMTLIAVANLQMGCCVGGVEGCVGDEQDGEVGERQPLAGSGLHFLIVCCKMHMDWN